MKEPSVEMELGGKIYGAILAGSRGGTYGEEDLRRYARYAVRAAEVYYEEFFIESGAGVVAASGEGEIRERVRPWENISEGSVEGGVSERPSGWVHTL